MTLTVTAPGLPPSSTERWPTMRELSATTSQQVFRVCLDVLSRPGLLRQLPEGAVPEGVPAAVAPLLALTDLMAPAAGLDEAAVEVVRQVARVTGAPVAEPGTARYAFAARDSGRIRELSTGTAWAPEFGAMLCQRVTGLGPGSDVDLDLSGPGVDGSSHLAVSGLSASFFADRGQLVAEVPTGIDILLITDDGEIAGLPRTTAIEINGVR